MDRICNNDGCTRFARAKRRICSKCSNAAAKQRDPQRYAYNRLKGNAKRRGKTFELTLEQFRSFCRATPYMKGKGRAATCYHVDRIDETKGYVKGNIQCLTNTNNKKKYVTFAYGHGDPAAKDTNERGMWYRTNIATRVEYDAPF